MPIIGNAAPGISFNGPPNRSEVGITIPSLKVRSEAQRGLSPNHTCEQRSQDSGWLVAPWSPGMGASLTPDDISGGGRPRDF